MVWVPWRGWFRVIGAVRAVTLGAGGKVGYKFYRLHVTAVSSAFGGPRIGELGLLHPHFPPTGQPSGGTASASDYSGGNTPDLAFDGSSDTYWEGSSTFPQWLQYELASPLQVTGYRLQSSASNTRAPSHWTFEASNDGLTWEVLDVRSGVSFSAHQARSYDI